MLELESDNRSYEATGRICLLSNIRFIFILLTITSHITNQLALTF